MLSISRYWRQRHRLVAVCLLTWCLVSAALSAAQNAFASGKALSGSPPTEVAPNSPLALPPDSQLEQFTSIGGKTVRYVARVGSLPVRDENDSPVAELVYTAYTLPERRADRPVTFVFDGGPGSAGVFLNLGALGPQRVEFGTADDRPSDPARMRDNPASWLDFTDLVFVDPVGTGFSRSLVSNERTRQLFYRTEADVEYLSQFISDWLSRFGRLESPKYLVGESYSGIRTPHMIDYLRTRLGIGINGLVLVSAGVDWYIWADEGFSPLSWAINLPSMAAANYERQGKKLTPELLAPVEEYASGEYVTTLLKGYADESAFERMVTRVSAYTGLDPAYVRQVRGRIDRSAYVRELYRKAGRTASVYEPNLTALDPLPWTQDGLGGDTLLDPVINKVIAPTTQAITTFMTRTVGWKYDGRYRALSLEVARAWDQDALAANPTARSLESLQALRQIMALDPGLRVLITHGFNDLAVPYLSSKLTVAQMPPAGDRLQVKVYPGGHMFYVREASRAALRADASAMYSAASAEGLQRR